MLYTIYRNNTYVTLYCVNKDLKRERERDTQREKTKENEERRLLREEDREKKQNKKTLLY